MPTLTAILGQNQPLVLTAYDDDDAVNDARAVNAVQESQRASVQFSYNPWCSELISPGAKPNEFCVPNYMMGSL